VKQGIFGLANKLYGITFEQRQDIPVYHPEVEAYDVKDEHGEHLALLYTDFHPRASKQGGAWMTSYREQKEKVRPQVAIVMNFTKPTPDKPALLTHEEVETFLHEFGHALHGIFADTKYASLSGTNVYWDFVELPSQFMENYAVESEFLSTFATHYQTGEIIPNDLVLKLQKSRNFNAAYACMRQVSFGLLDMAYYTLNEPFEEDIQTFENNAWKRATLLPLCEGMCMSVQFGHIMSGGYAAGYYSYKWAEVLDADAFDFFKQQGIFNTSVARKFRTEILAKGGTVHPQQLYRNFRGQDASIDALLRRNELIS
jgi:peptidyl-dipeptidase Dcp